MKWWVLQIFRVNRDLDRLIEKIDNSVVKLALNQTAAAVGLYEKINRLNEKKVDLVNLRVLYNLMSQPLNQDEIEKIIAASMDKKYKHKALKMGSEVRTDIDKLLKRCVSVAIAAGYYSKKFERIYPYLAPQFVKNQ